MAVAAVVIRGTTYPVVLPKLKDPRLHLAATITSLQVLGQVAFDFRLSIVQILLSIGTCAVLELAITLRKQRVILWPASGMLTGNGVAFVLRLPGNVHGEWWSFRGWWIYVAVSAGALLSKYVIKWRGEHIFNPSNVGLVACFVLLGRARVEPLDFWWGPMSWWMAFALAIIVMGGFAILSRLKLLRVALGFWAAFAAGIGGLALAGHAMTARWHLGPITGFHFWWVLVTSPEVLVFFFFMITDPKTAPRGPRARVTYAVVLGMLAATLIAPTTTEFAAKVALLGSLVIVCAAKALLQSLPLRVDRPRLALAAAAGLALYAGVVTFATSSATTVAARPLPPGKLPPIAILPSPGVQTQLDRPTAEVIAADLLASAPQPASTNDAMRVHLEPGTDQDPPTAVVQVASSTYRLHLAETGVWTLASGSSPAQASAPRPTSAALTGERLTDVAAAVGLNFQQGSFHYGMSNEVTAMMGGGVCWLDYNGDGWEDLFAVNSYSTADTAEWQARGGLPTSALFENVRGTFRNVSAQAHANLGVQGDGCAAADLNGDGRPDLVVTTTSGIDLLWNEGHGTFGEGAQAAGMTATGWYTGVAVADVNGDGRPDVFAAGYSDPSEPVQGSIAGFPTNLTGVRDLLYLNEGNDVHGRARFREVGIQAGLESSSFRHGLGATFLDYNEDGRPDLYVANDEDPNYLYANVPWPGGAQADPEGLGFRFEERGAAEDVADPFAGMGVATGGGGSGAADLFVSNSRKEPSGVFSLRGVTSSPAFANARASVDPALGSGFAGWGASFVDLANSGEPDLVVAAGAIPVTNLAADAEPVRVLAPLAGSRALAGYGSARDVLEPARTTVNGRGLAAADVGNDGRMDVAINTIGGRLVLLRPSGPSGHWLDVSLSRFTPGAVVTAVLPNGKRYSQQVAAGGSYLSSADPRLHFGLGAAATVSTLTVRYPWGAETRLTGVRGDRVLQVDVPTRPTPPRATMASARLASCTPALHGRSVATLWDETAAAVLRAGAAPEPVQARDLYDVSAAMWDAWAAYDPHAKGIFVSAKAGAADAESARDAAISYAAYRLLLWRASNAANLHRTFAMLTKELRSLCYSPGFTSTTGSSPAALGNRIARAAIAAGRGDGSHEALHYADPAYTPENQPLIMSQSGSTVHDPTFWQPLALSQVAPDGLGAVPAKVQSFTGAEWGHVRGFALPVSAKGLPLDPGPPPLGDSSGAPYKQAAVAVIRATASRSAGGSVDMSPLAWNATARSLPELRAAPARLRQDVRRYLTLNGALNDAAVAAFGAKRTYQAPRPISMIRYLAFQGQSSDPKKASYSADGLPLVPGLVKLADGKVEVLSQGRWVLGAGWAPPAGTPASPGWVSEGSTFAYAAEQVLSALTGRSFAQAAQRLGTAGLAEGIETPADEAAGRTLGIEVGKLALARIARLG